jgi:DNA-binding transcriptional ArsR family regulator
MSTIESTVKRLQSKGITLTIEDGHLRVEPRQGINPELNEWLMCKGREVKAYLVEEQRRAAEPADDGKDAPCTVVGIDPPARFCRVPHVVFRQLMGELGSAEFKVLCFLVDRIYGFENHRKAGNDHISYEQIALGIRRRDGIIHTRGTGLSRASVARALTALEARGLVERQRCGQHAGFLTLRLPQEETPTAGSNARAANLSHNKTAASAPSSQTETAASAPSSHCETSAAAGRLTMSHRPKSHCETHKKNVSNQETHTSQEKASVDAQDGPPPARETRRSFRPVQTARPEPAGSMIHRILCACSARSGKTANAMHPGQQ